MIYISKKTSLKPCPFCGASPKIYERPLYDWEGRFIYTIKCSQCKAYPNDAEQSTINITQKEALDKIVEAWNKRN